MILLSLHYIFKGSGFKVLEASLRPINLCFHHSAFNVGLDTVSNENLRLNLQVPDIFNYFLVVLSKEPAKHEPLLSCRLSQCQPQKTTLT